MEKLKARTLLTKLFLCAVQSAQPINCIKPFINKLPNATKGRVIVIGAGKASAAMAQAFEELYPHKIDASLVVTRYGYEAECKRIKIVSASHPVPDENGIAASKKMLKLVSNLTADDVVICLISGGGSALLPLPLNGITLEEKQDISRQLLSSGATISEMNCVRRHLSKIKGGRLAVACYPAQVYTLAISDVPGDNEMDIASGPTVSDNTTTEDANLILKRYKIVLSESVKAALATQEAESIKSSDERIKTSIYHLIATPRMALQHAADVARDAGVAPLILGDSLEGEASDLGTMLAGIALSAANYGDPIKPPCVILSGGETSVTLKGNGRGGRNVECLLSMALVLQGKANIYALAADTDGVDGQEEVAGAIITPDTLLRSWELGINPRTELDNNNGHGFFEALSDQVITGPTRTNVNDFRAILIL
ncbi:glycerate kinase type-2 family protein [Thorsellia anophelis]|uniref:Glycerate 2-kinase n=1 Tax=Thorsellia anophelis DSM 18579 TaxID=1123402 RepID=A0A1I0CLS7_9GAMM|nr:glycerate kinase [Thorsellia anophelis]SET20631.1 glycerate 2-kinase [Thorsellia anophelis DSM 18579]